MSVWWSKFDHNKIPTIKAASLYLINKRKEPCTYSENTRCSKLKKSIICGTNYLHKNKRMRINNLSKLVNRWGY